MDKHTACRILGIREDEEPEYIRKQYRNLMKQHHPDVTGGEAMRPERVQEITEAYRILKAEGYLRHTGEKPAWGIRENRAAFTMRSIFMEEDLFGNEMTVNTGIRGRYYWDPEIESFSLLLKSVSMEAMQILACRDIDFLPEKNRMQVQAKLLHLLLQEFIDPYESLKTLNEPAGASFENCVYYISCHLKIGNRRAQASGIEKEYTVFVKDNNLQVSGDGISGKISFDENMYYYIVIPMLLQEAARAVFIPAKTENTGKKGYGGYMKGKLSLEVKEKHKKDMTEKINKEIDRMLAKLEK